MPVNTNNLRRLALLLASTVVLACSIALVALAKEYQIESVTATADVSLIPQTNWTLKYVDSEELSDVSQNTCCPATPGTNAFDGDPATFWHSEWFTTASPLPHEIQIDLGDVYSVAGFRHLPRQDGAV